MRKLCLSTKFPHQEIRCSYGILRSAGLIGFWITWWLERGVIASSCIISLFVLYQMFLEARSFVSFVPRKVEILLVPRKFRIRILVRTGKLLHLWCFARFGTICTIYLNNVKNTHGGVLLLVKLQAKSYFTKSNIPRWVFFTFFKLYKCYQIAQRSHLLINPFNPIPVFLYVGMLN